MSRRPSRPVDTAVRVGALALPNPIVAASGTFGHGDEVARLCPPDALGAVTVKSLAAYPWDGNPAPRLHPATAGMLNSVGLQGPGVTAWIEEDLVRRCATVPPQSRPTFTELANLLEAE